VLLLIRNVQRIKRVMIILTCLGVKKREEFLKIFEDESAITYSDEWREKHKR